MPVSDWPNDVDHGVLAGAGLVDARAAMSESLRLLHELRDASISLGDALVRAGFTPDAWREPDAMLAEFTDQLPGITVDALLAHLTEFAASRGPQWLAGDGAALDDFEREVRALAAIARPLRALARREQLAPPADRSGLPLGRALADAGVGAQLDRLARSLQQLAELAPHLAPLTRDGVVSAAYDDAPTVVRDTVSSAVYDDAPTVVKDAAYDDAPTVLADAAPTLQAGPALALAAPVLVEPLAAHAQPQDDATIVSAPRRPGGTAPVIPVEDDGAADAPTFVTNRQFPEARPDAPTVPAWQPHRPVPIWPGDDPPTRTVLGRRPRPRTLVLLAALLVGAVGLAMALGNVWSALNAGGQATLTSAQSTALAGQLARAATATHAMPTPTLAPPTLVPATPVPVVPARLAVAPTTLVLPCPSQGGAALTLTDSGGQGLSWRAVPSGGVVLSAYAGTLDPGSSTTVMVYAASYQRGAISIRWSGGSVRVGYKVSCH